MFCYYCNAIVHCCMNVCYELLKIHTYIHTYIQKPFRSMRLICAHYCIVRCARLDIKQINKWKKRSEETQTLRAGCSKAEPNIFAPPQTPFPGARDGQNLISWRWSLPLPTNAVWWGSMHVISSYRGNRPTNTQTDRTDYKTDTAPQLVRSVIKNMSEREGGREMGGSVRCTWKELGSLGCTGLLQLRN